MTEIKNNKKEALSFKDFVENLSEVLKCVRDNFFKILVIGLFGSLLGLTYSFLKKPIYDASITFAMEDEKTSNGGLSGALGLASSLGFDLGSSAGGAFSGANLIELMKSRTIVEKALLNNVVVENKKITLVDFYLSFSGLREKMDKEPNLKSINYSNLNSRDQFSIAMDSMLGIVYLKVVEPNGMLTVEQKDKKISIINVDVSSENELFSKLLTEIIVKEVSEYYVITKSKKARNNVNILQMQVDSIRNELNNAISGVAEASDNTFNLNPALNRKRVTSTHRQIDVQANTAILTQLVTNLEMARVTLLKETPLIQIIDRPILPLKKEKIGKLKGIIYGGLIFAIFTTLFFAIKKMWSLID